VNLDQLELPVASLAPRMRCIHRRMQGLTSDDLPMPRAPTATRCWPEARAQNVPFLEQHVAHAIDAFE